MSLVHMASNKKYIKKCMKILKSKPVPQAESAHLLAECPPRENTIVGKIKEGFKDIVKPKKKMKFNSERNNHWKSTEKNVRSFIAKMQFCDACELIYNLEQNGTADGSELYKEVAQKMWATVKQVLDGDHSQTAGLQAVSDCIVWSKQKCNNSSDWIPQEWQRDLENLFVNCIMKHMPKFVHKKMDERCLENHLGELERKILEIINKLELLPKDLSASCLKCLRVYLCSHLTTLSDDTQLNYQEHVLLYKWAHRQHRRLCIAQYISEDFDHMLFENWFHNTGKNIESKGQEHIRRALLEILQSEIVWNSYPKPEIQYYFSDISGEATKVCEAAEGLGNTLSSALKSFYWEELVRFVTRYEAFLKEKVDSMVSENGIDMGLRIVKNCSILRDTANRAGDKCQEVEIEGLLVQCENKGTDLVFNALKPKIEEAFQNHFKKNSTEYENILRHFQCKLQNEDLQSNRMFITRLYHRLLILYIKAFFKCSTKSSHINKGETFLKGSKRLQEFASNLISDENLLGSNPLDFITTILTDSDQEALRTTTAYFGLEHPDLREEHLEAILNIKGNVSRKEREDLLYYIRERKMVSMDNNPGYFEDVQVGYSHSKTMRFLCCCCPC
ncbi:uncharacterized protein LOC134980584 [Pseudophryne corroboree]|uniref:uncharacterized protein LOC134980584 n=1 Tax=Pseudophryne corroboree TaxID=495146 RepID=UPI0030819D4C